MPCGAADICSICVGPGKYVPAAHFYCQPKVSLKNWSQFIGKNDLPYLSKSHTIYFLSDLKHGLLSVSTWLPHKYF